MKKMRLGINVDHVATIRNARGGTHPSPLEIAIIAEKCNVDNITAHLREDRRHVNENDIKSLLSKLKIPLNFEMAATSEMINFAVENLAEYFTEMLVGSIILFPLIILIFYLPIRFIVQAWQINKRLRMEKKSEKNASRN